MHLFFSLLLSLLLSLFHQCQGAILTTSTLSTATSGVLHLDPSLGAWQTDEGVVEIAADHSGLIIDGGKSASEDDGTAVYSDYAVVRCTGETQLGAFLLDGTQRVTLRRLNIRSCASTFAVTLRNSDHITFDRVNIETSLHGVGAASNKVSFDNIDALHSDNVTFSRCRFDDIAQTGISFDSISNLFVDQCSFEDIGAVGLTVGRFNFAYTGEIPRRSSKVSVQRSTFDNCGRDTLWTSKYSGAMALQQTDEIDIADCSFRQNRRGYNGAVAMFDVSSLTIASTLFSINDNPNNKAEDPVLGLEDVHGSIRLSEVSFISNEDGKAGSVLVHNVSAITSFTADSCVVSNQDMPHSMRGAGFAFIAERGGDDQNGNHNIQPEEGGSAFVIRDLVCSANVAGAGACVYAEGMVRPVHILDSIFEDNDVTVDSVSSAGNGAAVYAVSSAEVLVEDSTFRANRAEDGAAIAFVGHRYEEGVHVHTFTQSTTLSIVNCAFSGNEATTEGGASDPDGGALYLVGIDSLVIEDSSFVDNRAAKAGGAVFAEICNTALLRNLSFDGNRAFSGQGALRVQAPFDYADTLVSGKAYCMWQPVADVEEVALNDVERTGNGSVSLTLDDVSFTNNRGEGGTSSGGAAAVWNVQSVVATDVECDSNTLGRLRSSQFVGGCISLFCAAGNPNFYLEEEGEMSYTEPVNRCTATVTSSTFSRNAAGSGGGLAVHKFSHVTVDECTFLDNTAGYLGGGLYLIDVGRTAVSSSLFRGNEAVRGTGLGGRGGGLYLEANSEVFAEQDEGVLNVTDTIFDGNRAWVEGGALAASVQKDGDSPVRLTRCLLQENVALVDGGAVALTVRQATVADSTFRSNAAVRYGGAVLFSPVVRIYRPPNASLVSSTFTHNSAGLNGADVYAASYGHDLLLSDLSLGRAGPGSPSSVLASTPPLSTPLDSARTGGVDLPGVTATLPLAVGRRGVQSADHELRVSFADVRTLYRAQLDGAALGLDVPWYVWVEVPEVADELVHSSDTGVRGVAYFVDGVLLDVGGSDPPFALFGGMQLNSQGTTAQPIFLDPASSPHTMVALVSRTDGRLINVSATFTVKESGGINGYIGSLASAALSSSATLGSALTTLPTTGSLLPMFASPLDDRVAGHESLATVSTGTVEYAEYLSGGGLEAALLAMPSGEPARATRMISRGDRAFFESVDFDSVETTREMSLSLWFYTCSGQASTLVDIGGDIFLELRSAPVDPVTYASQLKLTSSVACGYSTISTPTFVLHNRWNHVVVTFSADTVRIFLNGYTCGDECELDSHFFDACIGMGEADVYVGNKAAGTRSPLPGYVRDFRVFSSALSESAVTQLYTSSGGLSGITASQAAIGADTASESYAVTVDVNDPGDACAYARAEASKESYQAGVRSMYEPLLTETVSLVRAAWSEGEGTRVHDSCICADGVGSLSCDGNAVRFQGEVRTSFPEAGSCQVAWDAGATVGQCGSEPCPADGGSPRLPAWMTTPAPTPTPPTPAPPTAVDGGEGEGGEGEGGVDDDDGSDGSLDGDMQRGDSDASSSLAALTTGVVVVAVLFVMVLAVFLCLLAGWRRQQRHGSLPAAVEERLRFRRKRVDHRPTTTPASSTHGYSKSKSSKSSHGTDYGSLSAAVDKGQYGAAPEVNPPEAYTSSLTQLSGSEYATAPTLTEGPPRHRAPDNGEYATASGVVASSGSRRKKKTSRRRKSVNGGGTEMLGVPSDSPYAKVLSQRSDDADNDEDLAEALFAGTPEPVVPGTQQL